MKQTDPLEKQLQSWTPRRPSPRIQARLFGPSRAALAVPSHLWNWLAPAVACALTFLVAATAPSRHADLTSSSAASAFRCDPDSPNSVYLDHPVARVETIPPIVQSVLDLNLGANTWTRPWHPSMDLTRPFPATNSHSSNTAEL